MLFVIQTLAANKPSQSWVMWSDCSKHLWCLYTFDFFFFSPCLHCFCWHIVTVPSFLCHLCGVRCTPPATLCKMEQIFIKKLLWSYHTFCFFVTQMLIAEKQERHLLYDLPVRGICVIMCNNYNYFVSILSLCPPSCLSLFTIYFFLSFLPRSPVGKWRHRLNRYGC